MATDVTRVCEWRDGVPAEAKSREKRTRRSAGMFRRTSKGPEKQCEVGSRTGVMDAGEESRRRA